MSNSLVSLSFLSCSVHQGIMVAVFRVETLICNLVCDTETIDESLLLLDLSLLQLEFNLHCFELLGKEFILLTNLLSGDSELFVLFLSIYKN